MMQELTFEEKEIARLKFIKADLEKNGLKSYENYKDLVIKYCIKGIDRDIKEYEEQNAKRSDDQSKKST